MGDIFELRTGDLDVAPLVRDIHRADANSFTHRVRQFQIEVDRLADLYAMATQTHHDSSRRARTAAMNLLADAWEAVGAANDRLAIELPPAILDDVHAIHDDRYPETVAAGRSAPDAG